jgi:DNA-binding NtrC family response regulator
MTRHFAAAALCALAALGAAQQGEPLPDANETGIASWYGHPYHGRQAASGEVYDMETLTAAHPSLPFNTVVRVHNLNNQRTVEVRITDRGPFVEGRIIDLSHAAARAIGMVVPGIVPASARRCRPATASRGSLCAKASPYSGASPSVRRQPNRRRVPYAGASASRPPQGREMLSSFGRNSAGERPLVGASPAMASLRRVIDKAARRPDLPVLLLGETGAGKEVVARAVHNANPRGPFVAIDCGSLVGTLMESELFGHVKGAFSGATENKKGLVELADGGTAFFDEIGDLPLDMQVKLLRVLQEREFRAVGALQWRKLDVRVIAATHRDLKTEIRGGRFREDLFYRLNVITIHIPPLRERRQDIPLLIEHFLNGSGFRPSQDLYDALLSYDWPGNVRELKHCIERMAVMHSEGAVRLSDMPSALAGHMAAADLHQLSESVDETDLVEERVAPVSPVIPLPDVEKQEIVRALVASGGERARAARLLGIGRTTLYRKMKQYGIG